MKGWRLIIDGRVQGVGFRPFIANFSSSRNITGWVKNTNQGVTIFWAVDKQELDTLVPELYASLPPAAIIDDIHFQQAEEKTSSTFTIAPSELGEKMSMNLTPDLGICPSCEIELFDPSSRYFHYPFISCTDCGPRYSVQSATPYDRERTSMNEFILCQECRHEYEDPGSRRFHAQSISCPNCSIPYRLTDRKGAALTEGGDDKLWLELNDLLEGGKIIAVKGIGGYLLMCNARDVEAVTKLRTRKQRPSKPFALLYGDVERLQQDVKVSEREKSLLRGPVRPIVLCPVRERQSWMDAVAPDLDQLGVMLPSAPVLNMICEFFDGPLVATSGNISGSPIIFTDEDAIEMLGGIADNFLVNDRKIIIPQDDSVIRSVEGHQQEILLRRSRGLAPSVPVNMFPGWDDNVLAMGSDLKSTISWRKKLHTFASQYMGNMSSYESQLYLETLITHWKKLLKDRPDRILVDAHPGYFSHHIGRRLANEWDIPFEKIYHHEAHAMALLAEHFRSPENDMDNIHILVWDGTGFGRDEKIWGGELFHFTNGRLERQAHLQFQAHWSGDKMSLEPRISALSYTRSLPHIQEQLMRHFSYREWNWYNKLNNRRPEQYTSSTGRLFDAAAVLAGWNGQRQYEGQAAMWLEAHAREYVREHGFPDSPEWMWSADRWDPAQVLEQVFIDAQRGDTGLAAARFHAAMISLVGEIAERFNARTLGFTGGVFQNQLLVKGILDTFGDKLPMLWHRDFSPNDESISLGQLASVYFREKVYDKEASLAMENY